tara:strand:+ start:520 stop:786 length:267 start_codon:yes stop_codon:yes gene_type:complete
MINIHRVFLAGYGSSATFDKSKKNGMVADTRYSIIENKIEVDDFTIRIVLNKIMGKDISNDIDKTTYYTILQYSLNEIQQIYKQKDGS